ncbi:hypothetical protein Enr17x_34120 [Gimesia fumaroli]|uniref:Uncharacterized protein n=1 Tax=Gimesia fumaroli TaxID=2527976 RepID=A0A518IE34_9PLAN|nr:hypothetical protein Enr17x_34120 [Gimesia fumaroli]
MPKSGKTIRVLQTDYDKSLIMLTVCSPPEAKPLPARKHQLNPYQAINGARGNPAQIEKGAATVLDIVKRREDSDSKSGCFSSLNSGW